jgi:ribosome assembly protein 1
VGSIASGLVSYKIRAVPMPEETTNFLSANSATIRQMQRGRHADAADEEHSKGSQGLEGGNEGRNLKPEQFWPAFEDKTSRIGPDWKDVAEHIWALGPRRVGPNMLIDRAGLLRHSLRAQTDPKLMPATRGAGSGFATPGEHKGQTAAENAMAPEKSLEEALQAVQLQEKGEGPEPAHVTWSSKDMNDAIEAGFQMAMLQGPMCAEPVQGMAYFVEELTINREEAAKEEARMRLSQITGSLMSSVREACKQGLLDWSPRLMFAMYSCDIQASSE